MLYTETVERTTFELIKELQNLPELSKFSLVGGTALALYMGHRSSIDIDLFTPEPFDPLELQFVLQSKFAFRPLHPENNTLLGTINGVRIDCITQRGNTVKPYHVEDGIRLYSKEDITAMKLLAISQNGSRLKDFIDIAYLSTKFSYNSMLEFYMKRYAQDNAIRVEKGLLYFQNIDFNVDISMMDGTYNWKDIEKRLFDMDKYRSRIFSQYPITSEIKQGGGFKR